MATPIWLATTQTQYRSLQTNGLQQDGFTEHKIITISLLVPRCVYFCDAIEGIWENIPSSIPVLEQHTMEQTRQYHVTVKIPASLYLSSTVL